MKKDSTYRCSIPEQSLEQPVENLDLLSEKTRQSVLAFRKKKLQEREEKLMEDTNGNPDIH